MYKDTSPPMTQNGRQLSEAESAKYLGIHLDRKLPRKIHKVAKKSNMDCGSVISTGYCENILSAD